MKLLTLVVCSFLFLHFSAQKELNATKLNASSEQVNPSNTNKYVFKVDETKLAKKNSNQEKTVEYYNEYIAAIEAKVEFVKNNPKENEKALASGWYKQMNDYLKLATAKREELLAK